MIWSDEKYSADGNGTDTRIGYCAHSREEIRFVSLFISFLELETLSGIDGFGQAQAIATRVP